MCGIAGYTGKNVESVLIDKLKRLEYRGYDSAGIAVNGKNGLVITKTAGMIDNFKKAVKNTVGAKSGIAHTRWATHGKPDEINAHPHVSNDKKWAIVHNGIIENYAELKEELKTKGMVFYSETDSEVVAKLLSFYDNGNDEETVKKTLSRLKGSYALAAIKNGLDRVYFAKNKSPLFAAVNVGRSLIASDSSCFCGFSKEYYAIDDGESGYVENGKFVVFGLKKEKSPIKTQSLADVETKEYPHFMLKEIYDARAAIKNVYDYYSDSEIYKKILSLNVNDYNEAIFTGCGTAYHACLFGAEFFSVKTNLSCRAVVSSELRYGNYKINEKTLVFLISQSGETADTLAAFEKAKEKGAKTVAVINAEYSALAKAADMVLPIKAGAEIAVASTKAYSAQIATLYAVSELLLSRKEKPLEELKKFINNFDFGQIEDYKSVADKLKNLSGIFMIGRGRDYYSANEASLKIKETCYISADVYYGGELKHGFLALIDENTYVVVFATEKNVFNKTLSNAEEARSRGAKLILFTCFDAGEDFESKCEAVIKVKNVGGDLQAIANILPWQFIAYYTSVGKGINPDKPRNLAKSVTVE